MRILLGIALFCAALPATAADTSALVKKLASKDNEDRRAAARELGELGKEALPALKALTKALTDQDAFVRRFAAQAIGNVGPDAKGAIAPLTKLIEDDKPAVREAAVVALAKLGPSAVSALNKALSGSADVREMAVGALTEAGKEGVPGLVGVIKDGKTDASLRRKAIEAVMKHEAESRTALSALTEVVKKGGGGGQEGRRLRVDAINALGKVAKADDKAAVSALDAIVKDAKLNDNQVKNASRKALAAIQKRK